MVEVNRTFGTWIPRYVSNIRTRNYSENTVEAYERVLKLYARYVAYVTQSEGVPPENTDKIAEMPLSAGIDVSSYDILDFFTLIRNERHLSAASIHQYDSALSSFYAYLLKQSLIEANPMAKVERPKIKDRELKYLRHQQVMEFIHSLPNPRDSLIVRTIYSTGMRISEICAMQIEHIDFTEETVRVRGKGGKIRVVFCDHETLRLIREHISGRKTGFVFEGRGGNAISPRTVQHVFEQYAPEGITPHKIRHSYATELYRYSHNIRVVQENLGHTSIKTTEIYVHTDLDERRNAYRQYFPLANGEI
ncbi:MAG TPA: tyrosine-type recombinase/integrase [Methanocorpusculum sp.]|nr:tyrosine-type recombinase/integrase [Methanocorpusculum sp.]